VSVTPTLMNSIYSMAAVAGRFFVSEFHGRPFFAEKLPRDCSCALDKESFP
jgi:hypothetical protein